MNHTTIISTPFQRSHSHFYDYITDFPGLPAKESLEEKHKQIMKKLRHQLLYEDPKIAEQKICYRNCFKLNKKSYVEFCLQRKCGQPDIKQAADLLGYLKKPGQVKVHAHEDHHHHH